MFQCDNFIREAGAGSGFDYKTFRCLRCDYTRIVTKKPPRMRGSGNRKGLIDVQLVL